MNETPVNQDAYMFLKALLGDKVVIWDLYVEGKWLKAILSSGICFSVRNEGSTPKVWSTME